MNVNEFWILTAVLVIAAIGFVAPALLSRGRDNLTQRQRLNALIYREQLEQLENEHAAGKLDEEGLEAAKAELVRTLARDTRDDAPQPTTGSDEPDWRATEDRARPISAVVLTSLIPVAAFIMYLGLGEPTLFLDGAGPIRSATASTPDSTADASSQLPPVEQMINRLERRLEGNPNDIEGWVLLARSYSQVEQFQRARGAIDRGLISNPGHPELLVSQAETIGRIQGNRLAGEPLVLLNQVLDVEPNHRKALWLTGIAELQSGNPDRSLTLWERLRATGPMEQADEELLDRFVAQAKERIAAAGGTAPAPSNPVQVASAAVAPLQSKMPARPAEATPATSVAQAQPASGPAPKIEVSVSVAPALASQVSPGDVVFVFARAANGPRIPLAIVRRNAGDLPMTVTLDDSMAMMPAMKLSGFQDVVVSARISKSGDAMPSSGDLEGRSAVLNPADMPSITLTVDKVLP